MTLVYVYDNELLLQSIICNGYTCVCILCCEYQCDQYNCILNSLVV